MFRSKRTPSRAVAAGAFVVVLSVPLLAMAAPGEIDTTFGAAGGKITDFFGFNDRGNDIAVQDDEKLVVVGTVGKDDTGSVYDFGILRYRRNGALDDTFGGDGKVTTDFSDRIDDSSAVTVLGNGKIVVVGASHVSGGGSRFALARYRPNGALDDSFGGDGRVTTGFPLPAYAFDVVAFPDGSLVAGGQVYGTPSGDAQVLNFALARYHPDGRLDRSFGNEGKKTTDFEGGFDLALELSRAGSKIVAAGAGHPEAYAGGPEPAPDDVVAVARYLESGDLDDSFSDDGKRLVDVYPPGDDFASGLAIDDNGRLVVGVNINKGEFDSPERDFAVLRLFPGGARDGDFGFKGVATEDFGGNEILGDLRLQGRKILVAGYSNVMSDVQMAVARFGGGGAVDNGFGTGGLARSDFPGGQAFGWGVVLQNGRIVVGGENDKDFGAAAFLAN